MDDFKISLARLVYLVGRATVRADVSWRRMLVWNTLYFEGPMQISEVARETGLPHSTAAKILNELMEAGEVAREDNVYRVEPDAVTSRVGFSQFIEGADPELLLLAEKLQALYARKYGKH